MTAKKSVKKSTATTAVKEKVLVVTDKEISYDEIWQFVQEHAGGNEANVYIVPLDNVDFTSNEPVPFGYGGKKDGVRAKIQNMILKGIKGDHTLKTMLDVTCKMFGHSKKKPCVLHALMHGGYSPSSKFWLTPYIKLVVKS